MCSNDFLMNKRAEVNEHLVTNSSPHSKQLCEFFGEKIIFLFKSEVTL